VQLTAVVESFPTATPEGVWTREKFHAGDASKGDHLRAEGAVGQSFLVRNAHTVHSALASAEQRDRLHLLFERELQLFLSSSLRRYLMGGPAVRFHHRLVAEQLITSGIWAMQVGLLFLATNPRVPLADWRVQRTNTLLQS